MDSYLTFLMILVSTLTTATAQGQPAPSGPVNITGILSKAGQFTTFIRLLEATQEASQINNQLNNSNQGLTVFAPTDNAFSSLSPGTLNSLTDQQKSELVQFHILPAALSLTQFQTASNPLRTQAGTTEDGAFPLNVTTSGNQVNVTTGVVTTAVSNTIYNGGMLIVYQVDKVLLPMQLFKAVSPAMAPAPAPGKVTAKSAGGSSDKGGDNTVEASHGFRVLHDVKMWSVGVATVAAFLLQRSFSPNAPLLQNKTLAVQCPRSHWLPRHGGGSGRSWPSPAANHGVSPPGLLGVILSSILGSVCVCSLSQIYDSRLGWRSCWFVGQDGWCLAARRAV